MGHRALLAYERPDESYNLHYTHWGGANLQLVDRITAEAPFGGLGGENYQARQLYEQLQEMDPSEISEQKNRTESDTDVEPMPREVGIEFDEIVSEYLDYQTYEALYVVSEEFEVNVYRTLWLGFSTESKSIARSPTRGHGILFKPLWHRGRPVDDGYLRGWFDGAKSILSDFIDREVLTESRATTYLVDAFLDHWQYRREVFIYRKDN